MKKTTWSSSDYLHEDSPRRRQIPQAHSSRLRTGQSGGCWLQGVLRTPVVHARNNDDDDDDDGVLQPTAI